MLFDCFCVLNERQLVGLGTEDANVLVGVAAEDVAGGLVDEVLLPVEDEIYDVEL